MKYSLFTLSLPECTPAEAAALIKKAGYDGVEWRCAEQPDELSPIPNPWSSNRTTLDVRKWRKAVVEHRKITQDHGLEFSNLASYCRADHLDSVKVAIEIAKELGCPRLRICVPPYDRNIPYHELFARTRKCYEQCEALCREAGVQGLLELHMGNLAPSASAALRLLDGLDPKHMGAMYDPGNMVIEGYENWQMGCEILGKYLVYCHAKNMRYQLAEKTPHNGSKFQAEACEMNAGLVDWSEVFNAFRRVGYDGWISNEDYFVPQWSSPLDRIRLGLEHLKRCATPVS